MSETVASRAADPAILAATRPAPGDPGPGARLARVEDHRLVTGRGRFIHNLRRPGQLIAVFVRSPHAHARIVSIDRSAAAGIDGVRAILVAGDLPAYTMPPINPLVADVRVPPHPLLASDTVVWIGQPVAVVVACTARAAQAAADAVFVDYEALPACGDHDPGGAPLVSIHHRHGPAPDTKAVAGRVSVRHRQSRVAAMPLEPRAAIAEWDAAAGRLTAWLPTQAPSRARADIARLLDLPQAAVRVIAPDVGGAFGAKASVCPEDLLVCVAAQRIGRPVKWTATRSEEFLSAVHGRGALLEGELTVAADGRLLKLSADLRFPLGAWLPFSAVVPARNAARILPGPYRVDSIDVRVRAGQSNMAAVNIYRGAGRPEAALLMERLIDAAARATGIDPVQMRLRSLVPADAMPYATPTGEQFDAGDYAAALNRACARFDYGAERTRQAGRREAGEVVGIGVAMYVEPCGQGWESARVTLHADGRVTVASGSAAQGQGHETTFARIAADALGCPADAVFVAQGDTAACPEGIGALASRSVAIGGSAILAAARGAATRRAAGEPLPITEDSVYTAPGEAWSYGCVIARLAIDAETGVPTIERIVWVDDAGRVISPALVEGQLLGGLAQGIGQALLERIVYDDQGQLLSGSLLDYAVPRADTIPTVELESLAVPSPANLLGAKGVGEAGCIGVPAALLNAAIDALAPFGVGRLDFPLTAEQLWRAMTSPGDYR